MALDYEIANFNILSWQDTDYDRNINPTPMDVSVPKMNPDGSITSVKVPNIAKKKQELEADVVSVRDAYELGGNYHSSGVQHEVHTWDEYKTIVQNTPIGGFVRIKFMNNITSTSNVYAGCSVDVNLNGFTLKCGYDSSTKTPYYIYRTNSVSDGKITIAHGKIETSDEVENSDKWYVTPINSWAGRMGVYLYKVDIYLNKSCLVNQHSLGSLEVIVDYCNIYKGATFHADNSKVVLGSYTSYNARIAGTTLNDDLTEDKVFGGTPRKI